MESGWRPCKVYGGAAGGKDWPARLPEALRPAAFRYAPGPVLVFHPE
jgi:hypothetical protein